MISRTVLGRKGLIQPGHGLTSYENDQDANWALLDADVAFMADVQSPLNTNPYYVPTAGTGLTLNISAGFAWVAGALVTYGGSTLTMTASVTNYVYLDHTASFAPAVNQTGFLAGDIPLAEVVCSGSAITGITDERTPFYAPVGVADVSASGIGGFVGVAIDDGFATTTGGAGTNNQVYAFQFVLPFRAKITNVIFQITTGDTGGKIDIGIYDKAGNRLLHIGATSTTSTGVTSVALGSAVTLAPGVYYLAWCADNTTVQIAQMNAFLPTFLNKNSARYGTCANAGSAGVLPATLGTVTGSASYNPPVVWFEP